MVTLLILFPDASKAAPLIPTTSSTLEKFVVRPVAAIVAVQLALEGVVRKVLVITEKVDVSLCVVDPKVIVPQPVLLAALNDGWDTEGCAPVGPVAPTLP